MDIVEDIKPIRVWMPEVREDLISRGNAPEIPINFLPKLNRKIWGLRNKSLVIVGGRTSQGKTSFLSQLAFDLANSQRPTIFLSLEETPEALIERIFCQVMEVNNFDLISGKFKTDPEIQTKWKTFVERVTTIPLLITRGIGKKWDDVPDVIKRAQPKPKVVIIDYIQAIATKAMASRETTNEYIRAFRQNAIEKDYVGILASQINRRAERNEDNEPYIWQLKETGVLEEHSDLVLLLHWRNFYDHSQKEHEFKIIIAKNRHGATGEYNLFYIPHYYKFQEEEPN